MSIEGMDDINKELSQEIPPEESESQSSEENSVQENFKIFLQLNGEEQSSAGDDVELCDDTTDDTLKKMNLTPEEHDELKQHINSYNKKNGIYSFEILREESKKAFRIERTKREEIAEKERRKNLSPEDRLTEDISAVNSPVELNKVMQNVEFIQGSVQKYSSEDIKNLMKKIVNPESDVTVMNITTTNGLRNKAIDFVERQIKIVNSIDNLRKYLKKFDNLEQWQIDGLLEKLDTIESGGYVDPGGGSIDERRSNMDQYGIIKRANQIMGTKRSSSSSGPEEYIIPTSRGDIKGSIVSGRKGGPGVVQTEHGKIKVDKLP